MVLSLLAGAVLGQSSWPVELTPARRAALDRVSAESLEKNLAYLSSDALEGRGTPSQGLDKAAEFIAEGFRASGLQPAGDGGSYFQTGALPERMLTRLKALAPRYGEEPEKFAARKPRNVIGVLPGSDPKLKDTYILVTAHYDHLGKRMGEGDVIYNGANDDGSGTVSVMEIAKALKGTKPKRSVVFAAFYGEELGLLGSRYYGAHPKFPVSNTVADINLEQIGRTDDTEGPRVGAVSLTGEDYSDLGPIFEAAGKRVGVDVQRHPQYSDAYFARSDNQALADLGVPSSTVCTAFEYPDYHGVSDTYDKIDYANLVKVDRLVALAVMAIADSDQAPKWNVDNPKAEKYRKARRQE